MESYFPYISLFSLCRNIYFSAEILLFIFLPFLLLLICLQPYCSATFTCCLFSRVLCLFFLPSFIDFPATIFCYKIHFSFLFSFHICSQLSYVTGYYSLVFYRIIREFLFSISCFMLSLISFFLWICVSCFLFYECVTSSMSCIISD